MRGLATVGTGALIACAILVSPLAAQAPSPSTLEVDSQVIPNKAGTVKNPQGVKIKVAAHLRTSPEFERPIVQRIVTFFPRHGNYNGAKYPKCALKKLADRKKGGPGNCPPHSIMGKGHVRAWADLEPTRAKITVINGGANRSFGFVTMTNPARVQKAVIGNIKKFAKGKWKYRVTVDIPEVLQVVAGIPIFPSDLYLTLGGKPYARNWIETTSCPKSKRWDYYTEVTMTYVTDTDNTLLKYSDSTPCR